MKRFTPQAFGDLLLAFGLLLTAYGLLLIAL
jgi:hypothetical protein